MASNISTLSKSLPLGARTTLSAAAALLYVIVPACSAADSESFAGGESAASLTGAGNETTGEVTSTMGETDSEAGSTDDPSDSAGSDSATDGGEGDGDGDGPPEDGACLGFECGAGTCVELDTGDYCECPPDSIWKADACLQCATVVAGSQPLRIDVVPYSGRFEVDGAPPPMVDFDDANIFLENTVSGDRVALGNTRAGEFAVRVTPGIYDIIYEVESKGPVMPHNPHVSLGKIALFEPTSDAPINIPTVVIGGDITLDNNVPPTTDFDDGHLFLRDPSGHELFAGTTRDGNYSVRVVPETYELVYRVDSRGEFIPHNEGAVLMSGLSLLTSDSSLNVNLVSAAITGNFQLNGDPAPGTDFDDANIGLESPTLGFVRIGNTHDPEYIANVLVTEDYEYRLVYMHESGSLMPQNQRALMESFPIDEDNAVAINIPAVSVSGDLSVNGQVPPQTDFDDGIVVLHGIDSDDRVPLGNTNAGAYDIQVLPGTYAIHYSSQSAGGTMPENTSAYLADLPVPADQDTVMSIDVPAVTVNGTFTLGDEPPPSSVYEDGRIFLRNDQGDTVLLGNTHEGGYSAVVVPGTYDLFYVQEAGGDVPNNQNARIGEIQVANQMGPGIIDIPVADIDGQFLRFEQGMEVPTPQTSTDGGQIYLRSLNGDVALLGDSFAPTYDARIVSGTYGVYYRSEASVTMPENENGRFSCITIE